MSNRICSGKPQQQTLGISEIEDKAVETSQPKKQQKTKKKIQKTQNNAQDLLEQHKMTTHIYHRNSSRGGKRMVSKDYFMR